MADIHNSQFGADVEYKTLDLGTPAWAVKPGPQAIDPVPAVTGTIVVSEDFEGTPWLTIPFVSGDWTVDNTQSHSPTHSYRSKVITDGQMTSFIIQNSTVSPQLSFWLRTDTEQNFDLFQIFIDGSLTPAYTESGFNDWHRVAINIGAGFQIEFRYTKDVSGSSGADAVWVDDVAFGSLDIPEIPGSPAHPFVYNPLLLTADNALVTTEDRSSFASVPLQTTVGVTGIIIIPANPDRKGFSVQNTGTTVIKLALGSVTPTQTDYHVALSACTVANDGLGGYYSDDTFIGDVRAISSASSGTLVALEVT